MDVREWNATIARIEALYERVISTPPPKPVFASPQPTSAPVPSPPHAAVSIMTPTPTPATTLPTTTMNVREWNATIARIEALYERVFSTPPPKPVFASPQPTSAPVPLPLITPTSPPPITAPTPPLFSETARAPSLVLVPKSVHVDVPTPPPSAAAPPPTAPPPSAAPAPKKVPPAVTPQPKPAPATWFTPSPPPISTFVPSPPLQKFTTMTESTPVFSPYLMNTDSSYNKNVLAPRTEWRPPWCTANDPV